MVENFDFGRMNDEQKEAVQHINGPCRVIAGAGSGKTTVLTKRIEYLLRSGINPKNILAITFTKKAAEEMKGRLIDLVGEDLGKKVFLGTFHSFGLGIIRSKCRKSQKTPPKIMNDADQVQMLSRIMSPTTTVLKTPIRADIDIDSAKSFISWQKNFLIMPRDKLDMSCLDEEKVADSDALEDDLRTIYEAYETLKRQENVIDFDDMLTESYKYLKNDRDLRHMMQNIYKYILVDEFQDTNVAQYKTVKLLADGFYKNVFIVGDARQAIYSWRASKVDFILNFENEWPNAKTIELNDNYRSTVEVVDMSTYLIQHSTIDYPGICRSGRGNHGDPIYSFCTDDETTEADMVSYMIYDMVELEHKCEYADIAILYRLNAQSRPFEEMLTLLDVPHKVAGSNGFYDIREIQELLAYLRLAETPNDLESFDKIVNVPNRGLSKELIMTLKERANFYNASIVDFCANCSDTGDIDEESQDMLVDFAITIKKIREMNQDRNCTVADILSELCKNTNYLDFLKERANKKKKKNMEGDGDEGNSLITNFIESTAKFNTIHQFLDYVQRVQDKQNEKTDDKVQLMSLHKSKGLEFKVVFLVGMINGILPHGKSMKLNNEGRIILESIEEERRLCYVGITRAKEVLFLSSYLHRGQKEAEPSIFFQEIHDRTKDISELYNQVAQYKSDLLQTQGLNDTKKEEG